MQILFNGKIGLRSSQTAIAVEGNQIIAVGSDSEVLALESPHSQKMDLAGKCVWPGLIDSHLHLELYSQSLELVDCETDTKEECLQRVEQKAGNLAEDSWILGSGWNQNNWQNGFGTAKELDFVTKNHPAFLYDKSLHTAWINSLALKMCNIDQTTPDPAGGMIQRDGKGNPTGILFENAITLVQPHIPAPTPKQKKESMLIAQDNLIRFGLTGVTDFDPASCYETISDLQREGLWKLRVTKGIPYDQFDWAIDQQIYTGKCEGLIRWGALKLFADGALGPQTAAMLSPYTGNNNNYGKLQLTADEVFETGKKAAGHRIALAIHAIGDRATHEVIDGFSKLRDFETDHSLPLIDHRVEHLQLLDPGDLHKCRDLSLIASMQPVHATSDMFTADKYWGERVKYAYAYNTLLALGTTIIMGSDAPVESPNPFIGIHAAVTRRRSDGAPSVSGWQPQERIDLSRALAGYSTNPSKLDHDPHRQGLLQPGQIADLIILPVDPEKLDEQELFTIEPESVMINGDWVLRR
jgi:predicted amidohydrolase YtcJ